MIFDVLLYLVLFAVLGVAGFFGYIFLRAHLNGESPAGSFFGQKPERRLDIVEQWSLDARRKLVLVRRDNVEHLIMTGGPVDVVIETGIGETVRRPLTAPSEPVFSRPARGLSSSSASASTAAASMGSSAGSTASAAYPGGPSATSNVPQSHQSGAAVLNGTKTD